MMWSIILDHSISHLFREIERALGDSGRLILSIWRVGTRFRRLRRIQLSARRGQIPFALLAVETPAQETHSSAFYSVPWKNEKMLMCERSNVFYHQTSITHFYTWSNNDTRLLAARACRGWFCRCWEKRLKGNLRMKHSWNLPESSALVTRLHIKH